jgi:tetratricopeptide (TPR) repeat protein
MTSFCGWLRAMLPQADPTRKWELINAGGVSYASYRVAVLMEELIGYEPDLFIIYSGHNEFLERRTYERVITTPRAVRGLGAIMSRTRTYTAVKHAIDSLSGSAEVTPDKRTYLPGEVETILESSLGPESYHRDAELASQVPEHYRHNLARMVAIARSVGARVILVTPASNLRDCSPFKSEHHENLAAAQRRGWQTLFSDANKMNAAGQWDEALAAIDNALAIDDRYAHGHYLRGRILWELRRYNEAKEAFTHAMDEDVCPLRASTSMVDIVAEVAGDRDVPMVDFVALIEELSEHGMPGEELFLDHVHPTIEANRQLALALLETMDRHGIVHPASQWGDTMIERVRQEVESQLDVEAHGIALRNLSRLFRWAGKFEEGRRLGLRAVEMVPSDAEAHFVLGANLVELGLVDEAIGHYRRALHIRPDYAKAYGNLGDALAKQGRFDEAIEQYHQALEIDPGYSHAHCNLGVAMSAKGDLDEAVGHFRRALQIEPDYTEAHNSLGTVLVALARLEEAAERFRQALETQPHHIHARYNLGSVLRSQGRFDEAKEQFEQILRARPDYVYAHCGLGLVLQMRGRLDEAIDHYRRALEIEPEYAEAHSSLADVLSGQGKLDEAIGHYRQALQADPNYAHAHCNLGVTMSAKGRLDEAFGHFRRALQIDPKYTEARNNLGSLLLAQGKLSEAIDQYRQALQTRGNDVQPQQGSGPPRRSEARLDKGVNHYSQPLRPRPDYARIHHNLGRALVMTGDLSGALDNFREAAHIEPNWHVPLNDAARMMATHPDPEVRNAGEAIRFAERAAELTGHKNVPVLDTLAVAYARAGYFDRAVTTIEAAIGLASPVQANQLREQLELYKQKKF